MAIETLGAALRQLTGLLAGGVVAGLSDGQLMERFLSRGDAGAFEVLLGRHGPMVLSVCRAILRDPHDAEDAFQATFLVLVQKGATIRGRDSLGGWLHQVAHRVANRANVTAGRRARRERQVGQQMAVATSTNGPAAQDDLLPALHEEIARLPEKYRLAVVHCDLEGMTQAEAAGRLHWSERTIRSRLAEGRARLRRRLARRGLEPDGARLGAVLLGEARAAVPVAWREATIRAALATTDRAMAVGGVSAAAQQLAREVSKVMSFHRFILTSAALLAAGLIGWGASAALISLGQESPQGATARPVSTARPTAETADPRPKPGSDDPDGTFPARGRVLDPDGKPVAGAGVYVRPYAERGWSENDPMTARQKGRVASTDADGRFHFELDKGASDGSFWRGVTGWHKAQIAVAAPGFAPAWVEAGDMVKRGEMALRLVRDDVPVRGRVVDSQGRPVAGVVVRIRAIWEVNDGVDLDALLASGAVDEEYVFQIARRYGDSLGWATPTWRAEEPLWPGGRNAWTTGADGRFEVQGIGRDRIARLEFHGGGVADGTLDVMARPAQAPPGARPLPGAGRPRSRMSYYPQGTQLVGATFDYIAGPTKPIVGVVRLKGSGKPVEGAMVRGVDPGTHTAVTARTDAAGRFRLDGVPKAESYGIDVVPRQGIDAFLLRSESIKDTEGLKPIEVAVEVPPGVVVTGRLIDKVTGRVVLPGHVEYTTLDSAANVAARGFSRLADGSFGLTVPPGRGMIAGAAVVEGTFDPYVAAHLRAADRRNDTFANRVYSYKVVGRNTYRFIDVPAGSGPLAVDLELTRGTSRAGRLTGPDGLPVVGAEAYGLSACDYLGTHRSRVLDADTFEVGGLEPVHPRLLVFTHKARKLVGAAVLKDEDLKSTAPLEVKLVPAGAITGRLLDHDGLPRAWAPMRVWMSDPDQPTRKGFGCQFGEDVASDAQGRFRIEAFVPGVETTVDFETGVEINAVNSLPKLALKPGEVRDLGDVKANEIRQP